MELNREQIIKALENCTEQDYCAACPSANECSDMEYLMENALSIIKELTEDNQAQAEAITNLLQTIECVRGVKSEYETFIGGLKPKIDAIKADTIEEYRQKVNTKMGKHTHLLGKEYVQRILREVQKEMKGE